MRVCVFAFLCVYACMFRSILAYAHVVWYACMCCLRYVCVDAGGPYASLNDFMSQTQAQAEDNLRCYVRDGTGRGIDGHLNHAHKPLPWLAHLTHSHMPEVPALVASEHAMGPWKDAPWWNAFITVDTVVARSPYPPYFLAQGAQTPPIQLCWISNACTPTSNTWAPTFRSPRSYLICPHRHLWVLFPSPPPFSWFSAPGSHLMDLPTCACMSSYLPPAATTTPQAERDHGNQTFQRLVNAIAIRLRAAQVVFPKARIGIYGSPNAPDSFTGENFTLSVEGYVEACRRGMLDQAGFLVAVAYFGNNDTNPHHNATFTVNRRLMAAASSMRRSNGSSIAIYGQHRHLFQPKHWDMHNHAPDAFDTIKCHVQCARHSHPKPHARSEHQIHLPLRPLRSAICGLARVWHHAASCGVLARQPAGAPHHVLVLSRCRVGLLSSTKYHSHPSMVSDPPACAGWLLLTRNAVLRTSDFVGIMFQTTKEFVLCVWSYLLFEIIYDVNWTFFNRWLMIHDFENQNHMIKNC